MAGLNSKTIILLKHTFYHSSHFLTAGTSSRHPSTVFILQHAKTIQYFNSELLQIILINPYPPNLPIPDP